VNFVVIENSAARFDSAASREHGRRLDAEFGGTEKFIRGANFRMTFLGTNFQFHAENF